MIDLKVIAIRDILPIHNVAYASGISPRSLNITGKGFLEATEVLIDDLPAPEWIIANDGRILAQVPVGHENLPISQVTVLAETPSTNRSSLLRFEIGRTFRSLQGIEKLVQLFAKILIQTPGSDKFDPTLGGGLLRLVGVSVDRENAQALTQHAVAAVVRAKEQIISRQSRSPRIPVDERLLNAEVEATGFNPNTTTFALRAFLTAVSGRQAVANLTF